MQLDLIHTQFKERVLVQASNIAKDDFWWWFRSPSYKVRTINKIYKSLMKTIDEEDKKG